MTQPLSESIVGRLNTLEEIYGRFILYRFLNRKIHPVLLLMVISSGLTYLGARVYRQSTKLVLTLVGVIYPLCRSWKLIQQQDKEEDQVNGWLTYWMAFGSFQVLDHWIESDMLCSKRKYNLFKLFILYWLQNPHSNGASLLYKHILLKPQKETTQDNINYSDHHIPSDHSSTSSSSSEEEDNLLQDNTIIPQEKELGN
ncbi:unnamed protein product [Rhizopus stolonifer]